MRVPQPYSPADVASKAFSAAFSATWRAGICGALGGWRGGRDSGEVVEHDTSIVNVTSARVGREGMFLRGWFLLHE